MAFFLSGCHQEITYNYLMQHPSQLKKIIAKCETEAFTYCEEAYRAAEDFTALVNDHLEAPEVFGEKIMRAQQQLAILSKDYFDAKQTNDSGKLKIAEQAYQAEEEKINTFYAVIVETSQSALR
jgi:hypothetical protein